MLLQDAEKKALELMKENGLTGWKFKWLKRMNPYRRAGHCNFSRKEIALSPVFVEKNEEKFIVNTILHEIAHVFLPYAGHNKLWKAKAKSIGCDGERFYSKEVKK